MCPRSQNYEFGSIYSYVWDRRLGGELAGMVWPVVSANRAPCVLSAGTGLWWQRQCGMRQKRGGKYTLGVWAVSSLLWWSVWYLGVPRCGHTLELLNIRSNTSKNLDLRRFSCLLSFPQLESPKDTWLSLSSLLSRLVWVSYLNATRASFTVHLVS